MLGAGVVRGEQADLRLRNGCAARDEFGQQQLGDAEVENLRCSFGVDHDIAGLEVAVEHLLTMGVVDSPADGEEEMQAGGGVEAAGGGVAK